MSDNISSNPGCPTDDIIRQLIRGALPAEEERQLTEHISGCRICQAKLNEDTSPDLAARARNSLTHSEAMPAPLQQLLETADQDLTDSLSGSRQESATWADIAPWLEPADDNSPGKVGPFPVSRMLGRGGMGVVFLGHDPELDRPIAIKLLAPSLMSDEVARQRFLREAQAVAAISHPSIVAIHRVEANGRLPWFAMEFVDGKSLAEHLASGRNFSDRQVAKIGFQVASALAAAHAADLIHRDIKPGNILIDDKSGRVRLMDFGLARELSDSKLTSTGALLGTPAYMAPETIAEQPQDTRTDLYGLGAVMYHLLTGQPPFEAATLMGTIQAISRGRFKPLSHHADVSPVLQRVVDRLLQTEPGKRFQTATAVADALRSKGSSGSTIPRTRSTSFLITTGIIAVTCLTLALIAPAFLPEKDPKDGEQAASTAQEFPPNPTQSETGETTSDNDRLTSSQSPPSYRCCDSEKRLIATVQNLNDAVQQVPQEGVIFVSSDEPIGITQPINTRGKSFSIVGEGDPVCIDLNFPEADSVFESEGSLGLTNLIFRHCSELDETEQEDLSIVSVNGGQLTCERCDFIQQQGSAIWINEECAVTFRDCRFFVPEGFAVRASSDKAPQSVTFEQCRILCLTMILMEPQLPQILTVTDCDVLAEHLVSIEVDEPQTAEQSCTLQINGTAICSSISVCHLVSKTNDDSEMNCFHWRGSDNIYTTPLIAQTALDREDFEMVDRTTAFQTRDQFSDPESRSIPFDKIEDDVEFDLERLQDLDEAELAFEQIIGLLRENDSTDR